MITPKDVEMTTFSSMEVRICSVFPFQTEPAALATVTSTTPAAAAIVTLIIGQIVATDETVVATAVVRIVAMHWGISSVSAAVHLEHDTQFNFHWNCSSISIGIEANMLENRRRVLKFRPHQACIAVSRHSHLSSDSIASGSTVKRIDYL